MDKTNKIILTITAVAIIALSAYFFSVNGKPGKYDELAICLKDKGVIFYGAFWCSHCQANKKLFGSSAKLLPYVECSTPDGQSQTQVCKDKGVNTYPTWEIASGTRLLGEQSLVKLSEASGCPLPSNE